MIWSLWYVIYLSRTLGFHVKFFLYIINDIVKVESAQFKEILGYSLNKTKLHRN